MPQTSIQTSALRPACPSQPGCPGSGSTATLRKFRASGFLAACAALLLAATVPGYAQSAAINPARITQVVDDSVLTTLKGNVHPLARPQYDRGPVNASLPANRMQLVLKRSATQEMSLHHFLGALQDKNSGQYRKWLTPEQFGAQYGASDADVQAVSNWLAAQGFKVNGVNKARTVIEFSGSVGQLQNSFHTEIHTFNVNGEEHLANVSDPQIPTALAPVVAGFSSMTSFFPRPTHSKIVEGKYDKATRKMVPQLTLGSGTSASPYTLYVVPGDAATIYDTPNAFNALFTTGTAYTGANINIAIAGDSNIAVSDVNDYRSNFGLPASTPSVVVDGNDPGVNSDVTEALLDLEVSGALAPNANLTLYTAANTNLDAGLFLAAIRALDDNNANILNVSFGGCEASQGLSGNQFVNSLWEQAAAQGITVTVSTGDSGSAGCDNPTSEMQASLGLQVNGLASTPYNVAVGGTDYNVLGSSANFTTYVSPTDATNYTTALGYIPESPWNDSPSSNGLISANTVFKDSSGNTTIAAAGGGASNCLDANVDANGNLVGCLAVDSSSNLTGYAKPSWQTGGSLNIPADGVRDVPDVSFLAADGAYNATWLVCYTFTDSSGNNVSCAPNAAGNFSFIGVGGTSAAAPAFAGMLALVSESQGGARLGQANYVLYNLASQGSLYSSVFHDVTSGNNSVYCATGSLNCGSNNFLTGYDTGTAYDQASGLGSVDVTQLVNNWSKAVFTPTTTSFTINGSTSPVSITHGASVALSASVTGAGGTPSGDIAIVSPDLNQSNSTYGANAIATLGLTSGATGSQSINTLPGGTYTVYANYAGDITYAQSQSTPSIQVTVGKEDSNLNFGAVDGSGNNITLASSYPYGTSFSLDAQPVGVSTGTQSSATAATGVVTFSDTAGALPGSTTGSAAGAVALNSRGIAELPIYYWSTAAHSVSASYAGDNSYNASAASALAFTITAAPTASALTSSGTTTTATGTLTLSVTITPNPLSAATAPTGTITFKSGSTSIGTATLAAAQDTNGNSIATATLSVSGTQLKSGVSAALAPAPLPSRFGGFGAAGAFTALAAVFFFGIPARSRAWRRMLMLLCLIAAGSAIGCGGGGSSNNNNNNNNPVTASVTASYAGDTNYATSTSSAVTITVSGN